MKSEVCAKTGNPHLTMHWIKEVEMAKSIDDLMTSRSVTGRKDFSDYGMLDAMIASALKRLLDKHIHFRERESVEVFSFRLSWQCTIKKPFEIIGTP